MIELTCPNCKSPLEVDDGFRGGVCRCFQCGTLMTVPEEEAKGTSEKLTETKPKPAKGESPAAAKDHTYTTRTGKKVRLSDAQIKKAPVARKARKSIRVAVKSVVIGLSVLLIAGVGALAFVLFRPEPKTEATSPYANLFDIEHNPYTHADPNFMGLPVGKSTVMLLDGSGAMRDQLDFAKQAVLRSIKTLGADHKVQVIVWREGAPWFYPDAPAPATELDVMALESELRNVSAAGAASPSPALSKALDGSPDQVTVVCRALPDAGLAPGMAERFEQADARLVIVHLDGFADDPDSRAWSETAKKSEGLYATLNTGRLRRWYEEYLSRQPLEPETQEME